MMNSLSVSAPYPDQPHYAWLQDQISEARKVGDKVAFAMLFEDGLPYWKTRNEAWHSILHHYQGNLIGAELGDAKLSRFAAILEDPSEPGRFRAQQFDANGFSGHMTRDTPLEVLDELVKDGYLEPAPGMMAQLSQTREWALGSLMTNLIAQVNAGLLGYSDLQDKMAEAHAALH